MHRRADAGADRPDGVERRHVVGEAEGGVDRGGVGLVGVRRRGRGERQQPGLVAVRRAGEGDATGLDPHRRRVLVVARDAAGALAPAGCRASDRWRCAAAASRAGTPRSSRSQASPQRTDVGGAGDERGDRSTSFGLTTRDLLGQPNDPMEPRASTALTAVGLAALRRAAVMAHTVGTISLRLTAGDERDRRRPPRSAAARSCGGRVDRPVRLPHGRRPGLGRPRDGPRDRPRSASARPTSSTSSGRVAAPGHDLGFGAVRAVCGGRMVWAFASILDPPSCPTSWPAGRRPRRHRRRAQRRHRRPPRPRRAARRHRRPRRGRPARSSTRVLDEVLRRMVAVVGAAELTMELG